MVELTVALHYVFDFRRDRLVLDVSHQCYPHKLLTGRRERFPTLRQTGGLCGFTHPDESEYDLFHTGHAGTSISLGLGLALAHGARARPAARRQRHRRRGPGRGRRLRGPEPRRRDAGSALLVVLNDNEWSISQVGRRAGALPVAHPLGAPLVQRAHQEMHEPARRRSR